MNSSEPSADEPSADLVLALESGERRADDEVDAASAALDLVDEALAALDQDDLERAEALAEQLG